MSSEPLIVTVNAGSSSLKLAAYRGDHLELRASVEHSHLSGRSTQIRIENGEGREIPVATPQTTGKLSGLQEVLDTIASCMPGSPIAAVGHRVVHGGHQFTAPIRVSEYVLTKLDELVPLAPFHQPHSLAEIRTAMSILPEVPQVACFDTAFHATMPKCERMLGLPRRFFDQGVKRYGFHGLSYESIAYRLPAIDPHAATGRTVVCHLGSGASLCAMRAGKSIATTMSFTPLDGLLMGTRSGAIDPGVILYLLRQKQLTPDQVEHLLDRESGLLGVSGFSSDMRELQTSPVPEAAEAVDLFCYRAAREIGAMAAALEGLDAIVFTGGIGENSPEVRENLCNRLEWLGLVPDPAANRAGAMRLNAAGSRVSILCVPADEEAMIARHTRLVISQQ